MIVVFGVGASPVFSQKRPGSCSFSVSVRVRVHVLK